MLTPSAWAQAHPKSFIHSPGGGGGGWGDPSVLDVNYPPNWGGGGWHKASVSDCVPLEAPIGLSPLLILTLCGPERVLVVSTEPPDDLSCLTTPGVGRPGDGAVARAVDQVHPDAPTESVQGFADSSTDLGEGGGSRWGDLGGTCPQGHPSIHSFTHLLIRLFLNPFLCASIDSSC